MNDLAPWARFVARDEDDSLWQFARRPTWVKVWDDEDDGGWEPADDLFEALDDAPEWEHVSIGACVTVNLTPIHESGDGR